MNMHVALPSTTMHQRAVTRLVTLIGNYLQGKVPEVFTGLTVWFDEDSFSVPDLIVVCDRGKIQANGCMGAPEWIIEVTEPGTAVEDKHLKRDLYCDLAVEEYWIVDISRSLVEISRLQDGPYGKPEIYSDNQSVSVGVLEGLEINLADIFVNG